MSNLRRVFGKSQLQKAFAATRTHRDELTGKWLNRLSATCTDNESREVHTQLTSILDWYNRPATGLTGLDKINWE